MVRVLHTNCGGEISFRQRFCKQCGKEFGWNIFLYSSEIHHQKKLKGANLLTRFIESRPSSNPNILIRILPNWPRWIRIAVIAILCALIIGGSYICK